MDIRRELLIQRRKYDGARPVGVAEEYAVKYAEEGADELYINDCFASVYGRGSLRDVVARIVDRVYVPVTAAGGISSIEDAHDLFLSGADKVAINTYASLYNPAIIDDLAKKYGSQAVVVQIDIKDRKLVACGGRVLIQRSPFDWMREVISRGAGELIIVHVNADGMLGGAIHDYAPRSPAVSVPVVMGGGFCSSKSVAAAFSGGADAVVIGRAFHENHITIAKLKSELLSLGVPVRVED
jgi:cyclase